MKLRLAPTEAKARGLAGAHPMPRLLITLGIILVLAGLAWPLLARLGFGHLPGDLRIERDGFTLFIPFTSGLIVSVIVSLVLWLLQK